MRGLLWSIVGVGFGALVHGANPPVTIAGRTVPSPTESVAKLQGALWIGAPQSWLAWLEGESREGLAVRAARWTGGGWSAIETVSPPGPGAQLALAGATAEGGAPVLVWAGYDGTDDEILWSRRETSGWTQPARIAPDDGVPDILPSIVTGPGGAIAAWSHYDGNDYRVVVSRLVDWKWTRPATLGPKASYHAALGAAPNGRTALAFQTVAGWQVIELDRHGRPTGRRADIPAPADPDDRAAIESAGAKNVTLRWRESGATTVVDWR